ncbi:MAG: hypothetical protein HQK54_16025, partial [Oligoflexales bacterium]|nr:hypothetical protein [Oligoflexales bacterium]
FLRCLKVSKQKIYLKNCIDGHAGDTDLIRNYHDAKQDGTLQSGDYFIMSGIGKVGIDFQYSALLLRKN